MAQDITQLFEMILSFFLNSLVARRVSPVEIIPLTIEPMEEASPEQEGEDKIVMQESISV